MLKFSKECDRFALVIDGFLAKKDFDGITSYLPGLKAFANEHDTPEYAPIFYYLGTMCGELANQLHREGKNYLDCDIIEYRKSAMLYFRKALEYIPDLSETFLALPLLTNYANDIDSCGRILEALRLFREAIKIQPQFAMALGNYGRTLSSLANMVNDSGHYKKLHCYAFQAMSRAMHLKYKDYHFYKNCPLKLKNDLGFVLFSILCNINYAIEFVEKYFVEEILQKFKFAYLQYYYLCDFITDLNICNATNFYLDATLKNRDFRNCLAHYGLGQFLKECDIMDNDVLKGLTNKAFNLDYITAKKLLYGSLHDLAEQIKKAIC